MVPSEFSRTDAVLVVAPHPDDETLCCAGVIQRARAAGARVAIVWLTGGDAFELDAILVERRLLCGASRRWRSLFPMAPRLRRSHPSPRPRRGVDMRR